jgi:DNA-binding NarL/FixJ family response regulator
LRYLLEATSDIKVVAEASNGNDALFHIGASCPDVAIVDISMPLMDGLETTRQIHERCRLTRVIMLSIYDNPEYVQRSLDVGAVGYVLKDTIVSDLMEAVRTVSEGKHYFSQKIAEIGNKHSSQKGDDRWAV